jgi:hypothetical protein
LTTFKPVHAFTPKLKGIDALTSNPILIYIKIQMSLFLLVIHLKMKFFNENTSQMPSPLVVERSYKDSTSYIQTSYAQTGLPSLFEDFFKTYSVHDGREQLSFFSFSCVFVLFVMIVLNRLFSDDSFAFIHLTSSSNTSSSYISTSCKTTQTKEVSTVEFHTQTQHDMGNRCAATQTTGNNESLNYKVHETRDEFVQTFDSDQSSTIQTKVDSTGLLENPVNKRSLGECVEVLKERSDQILDDLLDDEIIELVKSKNVAIYKLESHFSEPTRGIELRYQNQNALWLIHLYSRLFSN